MEERKGLSVPESGFQTVGIVGLGYVGLPLAMEVCRAGYECRGVDVDRSKVEALLRGESPILDVPSEDVARHLGEGRFRVSADYGDLGDCQAVIICVPTPLRKTKDPDVSYVLEAARRLKEVLSPGMLVILESTVYPGATEELVGGILEETGLRVGRDFHLAFSPERVDPGNRSFPLRRIPKVVGGVTPECGKRAASLYRALFDQVIEVASAREAEMVKLLENIFRAVNIGLVNELAVAAHKMGINIWNVIEAAATKPFGFMPFYPGPGLGGHCIPIDPFYLAWKAKIFGAETAFIELAGRVNSSMPRYVVERAAELLNRVGRPIRGSRFLVLGVAYKRDVSDTRESPALDIMEMLAERGGVVEYHDPYVPEVRLPAPVVGLRVPEAVPALVGEGWPGSTFPGSGVPGTLITPGTPGGGGNPGSRVWRSVELSPEELAGADLVLILTDHSSYDWDFVVRHARLIFDTRNATRGVRAGREHVHLL